MRLTSGHVLSISLGIYYEYHQLKLKPLDVRLTVCQNICVVLSIIMMKTFLPSARPVVRTPARSPQARPPARPVHLPDRLTFIWQTMLSVPRCTGHV